MQKPARNKGELHTYFVRVSAKSLCRKIYADLLRLVLLCRKSALIALPVGQSELFAALDRAETDS